MNTAAVGSSSASPTSAPARLSVTILSDTPGLVEAATSALKDLPVDLVHLPSADWLADPHSPSHASALSTRVLLADPGLVVGRLDLFPNLAWMHSTWTGVDMMMPPTRTDYALTRLSELGAPMAEFVIACVLSRERHFASLAEQQRTCTWTKLHYRHFPNISVGVMGITGRIGSCVARALRYMGCHVVGLASKSRDSFNFDGDGVSPPSHTIRGTPFGTAKVFSTAHVADFLSSQLDYIVAILPSTAETRGLLSGDALRSASASRPVLINTGRGDLLSESDVIKALDEKWISHAVLDVFEEEPLPIKSALWKREDVTVTPHNSAISYADAVVACFRENVGRFVGGEELMYKVDFEKGY